MPEMSHLALTTVHGRNLSGGGGRVQFSRECGRLVMRKMGLPLENASPSKEGEEEVTARVSRRRHLIQRQICRGFEMVGEKSKAVAFLPPPGRQGKKPRKRRDSREEPVQAP